MYFIFNFHSLSQRNTISSGAAMLAENLKHLRSYGTHWTSAMGSYRAQTLELGCHTKREPGRNKLSFRCIPSDLVEKTHPMNWWPTGYEICCLLLFFHLHIFVLQLLFLQHDIFFWSGRLLFCLGCLIFFHFIWNLKQNFVLFVNPYIQYKVMFLWGPRFWKVDIALGCFPTTI